MTDAPKKTDEPAVVQVTAGPYAGQRLTMPKADADAAIAEKWAIDPNAPPPKEGEKEAKPMTEEERAEVKAKAEKAARKLRGEHEEPAQTRELRRRRPAQISDQRRQKMSMLGGLRSLLGLGLKAAPEGAYHEGPYRILTTSSPGWLPPEWGAWNHWQMNQDPRSGAGISAMVEACVSAYAQTVSMCPMAHWELLGNGGREQVTTSALSRIAIVPNDYQTRSDFLLNLVRSLYLDGNGYALALRNNRFEIASLHGMDPRLCHAEVIDGEIFYELGGNPVIDGRVEALGLGRALRFVPARDVLHVKLNSVTDVLHGETPLCAAALAVAANNAILRQSISFFGNQSRPSGILSTDQVLSKPRVDELKERWNDVAKGLNVGGVPILTAGLKFQPMAISARDTMAIEALKLNDAMVAQVFRVPLAIVGSEQQPMGSTEALMNFWIAGGLGFALDRVELAFDKLFGLPASEYSELDSSVLLRSNLKDKIEAFARGTIAGIHAPNEARAEFELPAVEFGDEPRVQQQVVPLSFAAEPPAPPAAPSSLPPAAPVGDASGDGAADPTKSYEQLRNSFRSSHARTLAA